ncbi:MAG: LacI family DNA-binding transcriptional regulator [Lachnospiraceae bacterium]|nr:LacI family DNA-binding transcriptional regulator [Lachnospiraceae bacterium]
MERKITIYTIAKEAEVSPATVSRVLNNSANVSTEKRQKIEHLIRKYNFSPSALARGLTEPRRKVIGLIAADVRNPFYAELYVSCEIAAAKKDYSIMLINTFGKVEVEKQAFTKLMEQRVDGIIHLGGVADDEVTDHSYVKLLEKLPSSVPYVTTGKFDGIDCYQVQIDEAKALDLLMKHLSQNGKHRVALLGGRNNVVSTRIKYERFLEKGEAMGFSMDPDYLENWGYYTIPKGEETMDALFDKLKKKRKPLPEAVIGINDSTAIGACESITKHGLRIPEDISVVGYDNIYMTQIVEPNLTTVDYNFVSFGQKLVDTVIDSLDGKEPVRKRLVHPTLVVRRSSDSERSGS